MVAKIYSKLEEEALDFSFGDAVVRDYLLRRSFTMKTDHEPLVGLLGNARLFREQLQRESKHGH